MSAAQWLPMIGYLPDRVPKAKGFPPSCSFFFLLTAICLTVLGGGFATVDQHQQLEERDRYKQQSQTLYAQGKIADAIFAARKSLQLTREVCANVDEEVVNSLDWLVQLYIKTDDLSAAEQAQQELLKTVLMLYGKDHWRATDARWTLKYIETLADKPPASRRQVIETEELYHQHFFRTSAFRFPVI